MKTTFFAAAVLALATISCKQNKTQDQVQTKNTLVVQQDSAVTTVVAQESIITKNEGKYPHDLKLFEDKDFGERFKKLVGTQYDEIIKNFNVETPVVSEAGIYKFTGCKQHDCAAYQTTVLYDANNDNVNVFVDQNGTTKEYSEKGKINYTNSLKSK